MALALAPTDRDAKRLRTVDHLPPSGILAAIESAVLPDGLEETGEEKKSHWFVGSIDQGTTSTRFLIFNGHGDPVASHQLLFKNHYPHSGFVSCPHLVRPFPLPAERRPDLSG